MRQLTIADPPSIMDVEPKIFVPGARVSEDGVRQRLELAHPMISLEEGDVLVGIVSFLCGDVDPNDRESFPKTQALLSTQPTSS